jgi:hypothetical protein
VSEYSSGDTQAALIDLEPLPGIAINRRVRMVDSDGQRGIFVGGMAIALYEADDKSGDVATMALLGTAKAATGIDLANAFGVHRNTMGRLLREVREGGMAAAVPARPGPKGPHKITPEVTQVIAANADLTLAELMVLVNERTGIEVSHTHMRRLRRRARARDEQPGALGLELDKESGPSEGLAQQLDPQIPVGMAAPVQDEEPMVVVDEDAAVADSGLAWDPPAVVAQQTRGRYLGAALYYPAIETLGLIQAARACFQLPNSELFGVRAVTLTLFYLSLLGKTTVEAAKHLRRWEFGPLVGSGRAPVVMTLRRKLAAMGRQGGAVRFGELLSRRWVEQAVVATAYLYIDGHMKLYTGKRKLSEAWNSQRRMPLPGFITYYVNDQQSRPLLFITEEANASLAKAMPRIVDAIREVLGDRAFTVIFDRGGFDGKLFMWLREQGIDFITYQRGNPNRPLECFGRRQCRFEGQQRRMQIAEDAVKVSKSGPWRRIVVRTKDGHQTPILTSLGEAHGAAKIACLIFARWRQENFFRYMREHHGIDQLLGYAAGKADGARMVPNPDLRKTERELKTKRKELAALRAELGQAVLDEPRQNSRTAHGLKIAQNGAVAKVRTLEARIAQLMEERRELPKRVPLSEAGEHEVLRLQQKEIIDRIKITAYNAEEWLLERLIPHYDNPHDVRDLLRSFAQLSGEIKTTGRAVTINLDPPDLPRHRLALRGLCADLSRLGVVYPGTDMPVTYAVAMHHSELAA